MRRRAAGEHLSLGKLDALVARRLSLSEETEALLHLLCCAHCQQELLDRHPTRGPSLFLHVFGKKELPRASPRQADPERLRRGMQAVRCAVVELEEAEQLWQQIARQSPQHRTLMIRNTAMFHTLGMAVVLLEKCRSLWLEAPTDSVALASDALLVLGACRRRGESRAQLDDVTARAHSYRGNCQRILGHVKEAEHDFRCAHQHLAGGTGDPLERALVLEQEAVLFRDQRRLVDAKMALRESARLYSGLADTQGACRVSLVEALVLREIGRPAYGVQVLQRILSTYSQDEMGSDTHYRAHHNLVLLLADSGRAAEAKLHLPRVRQLAERLGSRFDRARTQWLEATVYERAGELGPAETCYRRVRGFFVGEGIGCEAALVTLDLAAMLLTVDRTAEVRELAAEMTPIFLAHDIQREALAALKLFQQAAAQEAATAALARETAQAISRLRRRPAQ